MSKPESCLTGRRCLAPLACTGWGYCRYRNLTDVTTPTEAQIAERRKIAAGRAALATQTRESDHAE